MLHSYTTPVQCAVDIGSACFVSRKGGTEGGGDSTWQLLCPAVEWPWSTLDGVVFNRVDACS